MTFVLIIIGIIFLISFSNLRTRVQKIESLLGDQLQEPEPFSVPQAATSQIQKGEVSIPQNLEKDHQPSPDWYDKSIEWLKQDWLLKLGAFFLLMGFGWLTTYAFLNNWIGPMGRIALGIIAGTLILLFGWIRMKKYLYQGSIFLVLGSTVVLLTIFAAREIYQYFDPISALFVMFLSTVFVALASIKYKLKSLALVSLILAGIAPLLANSIPFNYVFLFFYLLIITLGTVWLAALTDWKELTTAALIGVTFYSLPHFASILEADKGVLLLFVYAFAAIFFASSTLNFLRLKDKNIVPILITAGGNGLLLLSWILFAAQDEWKSLIIITWMLVFTVGAFAVFRVTKNYKPFYTYSGISIAMLAAATATELGGASLAIAYIVESAMITLVAYFILKDLRLVARTSLIFIVPILLSFSSIISIQWINKEFFVVLMLSLSLMGLGKFFLDRRTNDTSKEVSQLITTSLILGSIYAYVLLWQSLKDLFLGANISVMISLVVYAVIGLTVYLHKKATSNRTLRLYGLSLLGFVIGRLLLVDVWNMELTGKIVIFFLVGALFMSTAFLGKKTKTDNIQQYEK